MKNKPLIAILCDIIELKQDQFMVNASYVKSIEAAGGFPILLPYNKGGLKFLKKVDGILLIGGGIYFKDREKFKRKKLSVNNPKRYNYEKKLIKFATSNKIPLMGICRGAETICEVLGGKIDEETSATIIKNHKKTKHELNLVKGTLLHKAIKQDRIKVNSFHVKIIKTLPKTIKLSGVSKDFIIESFESKDGKILGFQFHPEQLPINIREPIFKLFMKQIK